MDFNENTKPQFMYRHNPLIEHAYDIFEFKDNKGEYEPVGEYTLLDTSENPELTEKKVINLISILNGRKRLIDVTNLTNTRILFNIVPKQSEDEPTKIIFREHDGNGTSKENAMLVLEKGVLNDDTIPT
ncbi:MAG: hypothetical protein KTR28_05640 [Micavibrio sp.]|nr:hypothetical protein [Micavibrio sp.]